jgi:hypothetical protein
MPVGAGHQVLEIVGLGHRGDLQLVVSRWKYHAIDRTLSTVFSIPFAMSFIPGPSI